MRKQTIDTRTAYCRFRYVYDLPRMRQAKSMSAKGNKLSGNVYALRLVADGCIQQFTPRKEQMRD
jgi:hypothetical protein